MGKKIFLYKLEDLIVIYAGRTIKELEALNSQNKELIIEIDKNTIDVASSKILSWDKITIVSIVSAILDSAKTIKIDAEIINIIQSFLESLIGHENISKYKEKMVVLLPNYPFEYYTVEEINAMMRSMPHPEDNCMEENSDKDYSVNEE